MRQAKRSLSALSGTATEQTLQERIALCQGAQDLVGKLETMNQATLVLNLNLLKGHFSEFPLALQLRVTRKLYQLRFAQFLKLSTPLEADEELEDEDACEQAANRMASSFVLWADSASSRPLMDFKEPSFAAIYLQLKEKVDKGEGLSDKDEDSDAEFAQLRKSMHAKKDDEGDQSQSGSGSGSEAEEGAAAQGSEKKKQEKQELLAEAEAFCDAG